MADRSCLIPSGVLEVPCPPCLHRATYKRLIREYNRLIAKLSELPRRPLWPHMRLAYRRQFENRIIRIRRVLHMPTPHPRSKPWYRTGEAALFLGISSKTLIRWTNQGIVRCVRGRQRRYTVAELTRVRHSMKV